MSLQAMPMLLVNLGCQMVYILDQRLKAQSIPNDKACRVLSDVMYTMFDATFVEKMFAPQDLYSLTSTRKIFERVVHSSIMRLSEQSMDKLFDLMIMGVKYQIYCASRLEQMIEVTNLHLDTVRAILSHLDDPAVFNLIEGVRARMARAYGSLSAGQLHMLRQTLQRYFLDKRIKVSLFLLEGIQSASGRLILPSPNAPSVGSVTYYREDGSVTMTERLRLNSQAVASVEFFVHPEPLGANLYDKARTPAAPPDRSFDTQQKPAAPGAASLKEPVAAAAPYAAPTTSGGTAAFAEEVMQKGGAGARHELDLLAAVMAVPARAQHADNFKLNLFDVDGPGLGSGGGGGPRIIVSDNRDYRRDLDGAMTGLGIADDGGRDDLLDLMDNA